MRLGWALLGLFWAAAGVAAEPDFQALSAQIDRSLAAAGRGGLPGERLELDQTTSGGWSLRISAAWDGDAWRLLALRLHHPERVDTPDPNWLQRYQTLLAALSPNLIQGLGQAELFTFPAPSFLPVWPGEVRTRQFILEQFWYQSSWFNQGGPDEFASWQLRSFEMVAAPKEPD